MAYGSILGFLDRLSVKTVLTNHMGSYLGFLGTLGFIAACIVILVPLIYLYNSGNYFESQFTTERYRESTYYSGEDFILAVSFRNKITNQYANHTQIFKHATAQAYSNNIDSYFKINLKLCNQSVFKINAINPLDVKDCFMLPSNLTFNIQQKVAFYQTVPSIGLVFRVRCDDPFRCNDNDPQKTQAIKFISDLSKYYYYEYIFTSKVLDDHDNFKFQFHKVYSNQYDSADGFASQEEVSVGRKTTYLDNSIMPWWNNKSYTSLFWNGALAGGDISEYSASYGFAVTFSTTQQFRYSYRYYKKLDYLLGAIGGSIFLVFLIFWIPFSYINRTFQKMKNAEELLIGKDQIITTDQNLKKIDIPFTYIITKWLPGNRHNHIINTSQHQIDIVKMIKRLKVAYRNLRTNKVSVGFKTKDIDFDCQKPEECNPDRQVLANLDMNPNVYNALKSAPNAQNIYENNPVVLAVKQSQTIEDVMADEIYEKTRFPSRNSFKQKIKYYLSQTIKFFDVFGAKPMLTAEGETSSCWGFFLTFIIISLSVLTFALTIKNMSSTQYIVSYTYEEPSKHNYLMNTSSNFRIAVCFDIYAANYYLVGATKMVQLSFFKQSKKNGYEQLIYEKMGDKQFGSYFNLSSSDPYQQTDSKVCFRPSNNQTIPMGGSYGTANEAYFGMRLDPYCSGTPAQCDQRINQTKADFLYLVSNWVYEVYLNQNKFDPVAKKIVPGVTYFRASNTIFRIHPNLTRHQTVFTQAIQILDDTSKSFIRSNPKVLEKTMSFENPGDGGEQRKGYPNSQPAYIFNIRPNGQVKSVILRTYKIDFLLGIIGGCFLFWYFILNIFAKFYNAYKVRAKLAEVLHQQDGCDQSIFIHFLYLSKIPAQILCCSETQRDLERVNQVDSKIKRDTDYLTLAKQAATCHKLSTSLFPNLIQKNLSLIYLRQKIDEGQLVKPKRLADQNQFEDDEFLDLDDQMLDDRNQGQEHHGNHTMNLIPENSFGINNDDGDLQKIMNAGRSKDAELLYDHSIPWKEQSGFNKVIKFFDIFKNPPELTLDGQRDVKSIIGGVFFFILLAVILLVVTHFLNLYANGNDYTVGYRRLIDLDLDKIDLSNKLGDLQQGITLKSGANFKFAIIFHKKNNHYPFDVSRYIGPIGIRMILSTSTKVNGTFTTNYSQFQFEPCRSNYTQGFVSAYNDPEMYKNLTYAYCLPDGKILNLKGTAQDSQRQNFKLNIYNKYGNSTGRLILNSFFQVYLFDYYMSVPRLDIFTKQFSYEMTQFTYYYESSAIGFETNLTFTKLLFTDKFYSKSRQTYNYKYPSNYERRDFDFETIDYTHNLSFYYDGMIDHYTLDYPGGGQLFGLVGGVIAMFTFIIYSCVSSFNQYRMKYLIGQRLYTFEKKIADLNKVKGKKVNIKKLQQMTRQANNMNELHILLAWTLSPIGFIRDNYNFNRTLRRVTLLTQRVQNDINLYNFYKNLSTVKSALNNEIKLRSFSQDEDYSSINLTSVYTKQLYNPEPVHTTIPAIHRQSNKHKFSSYDQIKINKAMQAKIDPRLVLGDRVLNKLFGLDYSDSMSDNRESRARFFEEDDINLRNTESKMNKIHQNEEYFQQIIQKQSNSAKIEAFEIENEEKEENKEN